MGTDGSASATANQINAFDLKMADCEVLIDCVLSSGSYNGGDTYAYLDITDNTHTVNLWTNSGGGNPFNGTMRLVVDVSTNTIYRYDSITDITSTTIDVSSLTGSNWWLKVRVDAPEQAGSGSGSASAAIYSVGYADGSNGSSNFYTTSRNITCNNNITVHKFLNDVSGLLYYYSLDDGNNYQTIVSNIIQESSNNSNEYILKIIGEYPSSISTGPSDINIKSIPTSLQLIYN